LVGQKEGVSKFNPVTLESKEQSRNFVDSNQTFNARKLKSQNKYNAGAGINMSSIGSKEGQLSLFLKSDDSTHMKLAGNIERNKFLTMTDED